MPVVTISETHRDGSAFAAALSFDHGAPWPCRVQDPFTPEEEANLEWYFEQHLRFPFVEKVRAQQAAESVRAYGERLFGMIFENRDAYAEYKQHLAQGAEQLRFVIAGSPEFHALHWEALRDPALPLPFSVSGTMIRQSLTPAAVRAAPKPQATINVLVVTARPGGERDVGYRTISRPLVESLRQANLPVKIDFVRPGTYRALSDALQAATAAHGAGYYHVVHFDTHGALMPFGAVSQVIHPEKLLFGEARYGRGELQPYDGDKAFIFLEHEREDKPDPVEAGELADLLMLHQAPVVILNACQSAKQQANARETSLGSRLMQAGARATLAMSYSVTVSAAEKMMRELYARLFEGADLSESIRRARLELLNDKRRRAYFNQTIALEDWLLPVVYQNQPAQLQLSASSPLLNADLPVGVPRAEFPQPTYGFFGRDLDILNIERRMLRAGAGGSNVLLVRGMGGAGKTTLLRYLAAWWQRTGLAQHVFYFGYDERAWTRQQLLDRIGRQLLGDAEFERLLQMRPLDAQQAELTRRLRAARHLLILDNCESITGEHLAIQHTLPEAERAALRRLLDDLRGGKTLVLLGSRAAEAWLVPDHERYDLRGLDGEAASDLAEAVLERAGASQYRDDPDLARLLRLLDGYPLAIQVILENLKRQTPKDILAALQAGDVDLDRSRTARSSPTPETPEPDKTESILKCVDYSHSNLDADAQQLLLCLAPFTLVVDLTLIELYTEELQAQPALAGLPFERFSEVLQAAADWGLFASHPQSDRHVQLQPTLTYFLRSRLTAQPNLRAAIETAFYQNYTKIGDAFAQLIGSQDAKDKQLGLALTALEYENLAKAIGIGLQLQGSIGRPYEALSFHLDATQDNAHGLELGEQVLVGMNNYPPDLLSGELSAEFVGVLNDIAKWQSHLGEYALAEDTYRKALDLWQANKHFPTERITLHCARIYYGLGIVTLEQHKWTQAERFFKQALWIKIEINDLRDQASIYHGLGFVALGQRQWVEADHYFQQALQIKTQFNDSYNKAGTYHGLGIVALEQRRWAEAERYFQQALQIKIEFGDRYDQANTYHELGKLEYELGQWAQAKRYYQKALQIWIEFSDVYHQASAYHELGRVAYERCQWKQAELYYQQALKIYEESNDLHAQVRIYHDLGIAAHEQRKWADALERFAVALNIWVEIKDEHHLGIVLGSLAYLRRICDDQAVTAQIVPTVAHVLNVSEAKAAELLARAGDGDA